MCTEAAREGVRGVRRRRRRCCCRSCCCCLCLLPPLLPQLLPRPPLLPLPLLLLPQMPPLVHSLWVGALMTAAMQDALDALELEVDSDGEEGHDFDDGCSDASFLWSAASTADTGADAQYPQGCPRWSRLRTLQQAMSSPTSSTPQTTSTQYGALDSTPLAKAKGRPSLRALKSCQCPVCGEDHVKQQHTS